jgi:hypothetical protein
VLDTVTLITDADCGNVQLLDRAPGRLGIVAAHGLSQAFVSFFNTPGGARSSA